jgi:acyl-CoA thioester hydrolase
MESFKQNIIVRWADLDPNGHVRHSIYYDYGAQARIAYLQQQGFGLDWMKTNGIGPILFREEAHFYRELNSGDELTIDVLMSGLSADHRKWSIRHGIYRGEKLCATLNMDGAWLNLRTRKVETPPQELRNKFAELARTEDFQVITSKRT